MGEAIQLGMALPTVKTTYTVDIETKRALDRLAALWDVSKSEALRRAIRQAAGASRVADRLAALDALQRQAGLSPNAASRWGAAACAERRASTRATRRPR